MSERNQGMNRLRELLFDEESARLERVNETLAELNRRLTAVEGLSEAEKHDRLVAARQLEAVFERAGSDEKLIRSIADVIDKALETAELERHAQVSRAVAPLVIKTIKTELRNSQDEMVEALYPITGRLVKAYVSSALSDLVNQINRRFEQNPVMLRLRSLTSGRSAGELAIADSQRLVVEELYLIRRGSGELLARWPGGTPQSNSDMQLSGVLTAITEFAGHAFADDGGQLRSFKADEFQFFLRASPLYLVAAKCRGVAPPHAETIFDEELLQALSKDGLAGAEDGPLSPSSNDLGLVSEQIGQRVNESYTSLEQASTGYGVLKFLLFLIAVPLLTWLFWTVYTGLEEHRVRNAADQVIQATPAIAGYPTEIKVGYRGRTLTMTGLVPNVDVRADLMTRLRDEIPATTQITNRLATLPEVKESSAAVIARLREQLGQVRAQLQRQQAGLRQQQAGLRQDLTQQETELRRQLNRQRGLLAEQEARFVRDGVLRAIRLARARLQPTIDDFQALESRLETDAQTAAARRGAGEVGTVLERIQSLERRLGSPSANQTEMTTLTERLATLDQAVHRAFGHLQTIVSKRGGQPTRIGAPTSASQGADGVADDLATSAERLANTLSGLRQAIELQMVRSVEQPNARERLQDWIARHAIFFANGIAYRDADRAEARLDELAARVKAASMLVRVVGYTDERGGLDRNNTLAQARARKVYAALLDRGVPQTALVFVGRADAVNLSPDTGASSPNRRVEFEIGFVGEADRPSYLDP